MIFELRAGAPWLAEVQASLSSGSRPVRLATRARVGNVLDVVLWLVEGGCDILFCYHHPQQPVQLDPERYEILTLVARRSALSN